MVAMNSDNAEALLADRLRPAAEGEAAGRRKGRLFALYRMTLHADLAIAAAVLAVLSLITLANVLSRYFIDISLAFTEEYSIALLVIMCMFGASHAVSRNRHIRITFVLDRLPERLRKPLELVTLALLVVSFVFLAIYGAKESIDEYVFEVTTPGLGEPQWLYTLWLPLGAGLGILRGLGRMAELLWFGIGDDAGDGAGCGEREGRPT